VNRTSRSDIYTLGSPCDKTHEDIDCPFQHHRILEEGLGMGLSRQFVCNHCNTAFTTRSHMQINHKIHVYHLLFLHWRRKRTDQSSKWVSQCLRALSHVANRYITLFIFLSVGQKYERRIDEIVLANPR
jgi:hypothetical protein